MLFSLPCITLYLNSCFASLFYVDGVKVNVKQNVIFLLIITFLLNEKSSRVRRRLQNRVPKQVNRLKFVNMVV